MMQDLDLKRHWELRFRKLEMLSQSTSRDIKATTQPTKPDFLKP